MKFLHYELRTRDGDVIRVTLQGSEANVMVMDDQNLNNYRSRRQFRCVGGHYNRSPIDIPAPSAGKWNVIVDLGGYGGHVQAAVGVI